MSFLINFHINLFAAQGIKLAVRQNDKKMIENGTLLQNRYLIEEQIGAGGMGAVYRAVDQRFGSFVAIKETFYKDDELSVAFEREARLLNSLQHPVLPHVSDYFAENNGYFLVMQYIEGEDFSDILKRDGAFSASELTRWANSLLDALDYLHSQEPPIIHRDIKPHNLKLTPRGDIILLDFGLAKLNSGETTAAVSVFGYSRTYSPLEQIQGTGTDARSDIFALGATAYHLLTGKAAVDALTRAASIVAGKPDPLRLASEIKPEIPVGVATVVNSALALNPDQRFASAKAMRKALEHAVNEIVSETGEELPKEAAVTVAAPVVSTINSAETDNFPALESFAEAGSVSENVELQNAAAADVFPPDISASSSLREPQAFPHSTALIETPTEVAAPKARKSSMPLAALAAGLIGGILAIFYFTAGANTAGESNQNPVVQTTSASEVIAQEEPPAASPTPLLEAVSQNKTKPPAVEKQETADESPVEEETKAEIKEESKPTSTSAEVSRPAPPPVKAPRRSPPPPDGESRSRVVEQSPVSDIESIFTGQSPENDDIDDRREERRRRRNDQLTDEERRELRRERQQRRRERQNRQPFPPF